MTSDYITPTRNAVNLRQIPSPDTLHPLPTHRMKITLMSTLEYYHLLVMTLCGFIKAKGQSLCHSTCEKWGRKKRKQ